MEKIDGEKSHLPMEAFAPQYLRLSHLVNNIFFDGESGAGVIDDFSLSPFLLRNNKPSIVIMNIVSNDIVRGYPIQSISAALKNTAIILRDQYHVGHVKICSILRRKMCLGRLTETQFGDLAVSLNNRLRWETRHLVGISYHTHRFFWRYQNVLSMNIQE